MNLDDCSVTTHGLDNHGAENDAIPESSLCDDMANSLSQVESEYVQHQQQNISIAENEPDMTTSSNVDHQYGFSVDQQAQTISTSDSHDVIREEKSLLPPNNEQNHFDLQYSKENTEIFSMQHSEVTNVAVISNYDVLASPKHQEFSDATNERPASLPAEEHNYMEIEQVHQLPHCSEVYVAIGGGESPPPLILETIKPSQDSLTFIGPVFPSYQGLETPDYSEGTSVSCQDLQLASSSDSPRENRLFPDDFRYNLSVDSVPRLSATACSEFQGVHENFLRGCKWSPDGNCVLTNSNDNCLRTFYPFDNTGTNDCSNNKQIAARVRMKECSQIYDFAWQPQMNLSENGRIACTCSGIPIHLWDPTTGQICANYRAYDQFDEITAAYSLSFSLDGRQLYAGYNKTIRIFDTDYPVRSCRTVKTYNSQSKDGQTGIISCFTFSPDGSGLYVAGSYSRHIGIYDSACDKLVCLMQGQHGGVTNLMFSPDATKLYSGGRKDAEILCWDMRNMDKILFSALRDVKTNQRIYFDLSQSGRYLVSGNNDGTVAFWDTLSPIEEINGDTFLKPCSQFQAHSDCVNGVSLNHQHNMVATASGQRHFNNFDCDSSDSEEDQTMDIANTWDFSLRLWQIPFLD